MLVRSKEAEVVLGIDVTNVIDMVFVLLMFFLVATTMHQAERELGIALPFAAAAGPISGALREIVVNVNIDGHIIVSGRTIDAEELRQTVAAVVKVNAEQKVTVRGDRNTAYANIVRVLDVCKNAGVQQPYLDTVLEK